MADLFSAAFSNTSFRLVNLMERELINNIEEADQLCGYIIKFLPHKFTTNHGKKLVDDEELDNEEDKLKESETDELKENGSDELKENEKDETKENEKDELKENEKDELKENEKDELKENVSSPVENLPVKNSRAKTIEELHKRIETLRGKKANYKDKLLKKGLKNRLKKKQKLEERKQLKKKLKKLNKLEASEIKSESDDKPAGPSEIKEELQEVDIKYNKLVLSKPDSEKKQQIDPKSLLAKLEKKKLKLKQLEVKGKKEKLIEIKSKEVWDKAIKKVEGVKIKDDVDLLKKSVAKIKNRKNKSKKKWEDREKQLESKKAAAQKKREENLGKKRTERVKKRTKVLVKKGRILPK